MNKIWKKIESLYPIFYKTAFHLKTILPSFERTIENQINDKFNFEFAERICSTGLKISGSWDQYFSNLNNLKEMSMDFLKLQVELEKTGHYKYSSFNEVLNSTYQNDDVEGPDYLWGLYFSEIFWKVHYNFVSFFLVDFIKNLPKNGTILEVPSGTGFFLCEFLRRNPTWDGLGVDISESSIEFSKKLLDSNNISNDSYKIIKQDFLKLDETKQFDIICCGEFLEHLENPLDALKKFHRLLNKNGKIFITVAVWAANIDHIYLYRSAEEVRNHIRESGFKIEKELVQAVFEKDEKNPEKNKIPVNYAAILSIRN